MRRVSPVKKQSARPASNWLSPTVFGLCAWLIFPSIAARADVAGLLAGLDGNSSNWRMVLTNSPAGSIHQAELAFAGDEPSRNSLADGGVTLSNGSRIAFVSQAKGSDPRPDEDRVRRKDKKGRVLAVVPMAPPKDFNAGSILQRSTMLFQPEFDVPQADGDRKTAFIKDDRPEGFQTAYAFSKQQPVHADTGVPQILASLVTNKGADILATGYAEPAPDYATTSPFDSILRKEQPDAGRFVPQIGPDDHAWAANILPPEVFTESEQNCLSQGIYFESRGESVKGQAAVAQVILNRVRNPAYPNTICEVVYQNEDWTNACQFSFACDGIKHVVNEPDRWKIAKQVAMAVTSGKIWLPEVGSATHYHAVYVRPRWAGEMVKVGRIGMHIFYRTYGGGWS